MIKLFEGATTLLAYAMIMSAFLFGIFCIGNSLYKTHQSKECSLLGGIPVEVANYIHCHE